MKSKTTAAKTTTKTAVKKPAVKRAKKAPVAKEKKEELNTGIGLYNLVPPKGAHKRNKLKGRGPGSGHGKTSTRGSKGETSRSGRATYPGFEGGQMPLIRKIPKRGFSSQNRKVYQIVDIAQINKLPNDVVTPEIMEAKGLIKDKNKPVKILGDGEMESAMTVSAHAFSGKAQDKIKAAGGKAEVINA